MSFLVGLLGGGKAKTTNPTAVSGLQLQSSTQGLPVQLAFGATLIAPNLIWYGDFIATAQQSSSGGGGGGKGGVGGGGGGKGGGGGTTSYTYSTAVAMALCEGPITGVGNVWVNKNTTTLSALGLSLFTGTYSQSPWGYLSTNHSSQALNYHGIAYVAASNYQLGNSPQLPNHNIEVFGLLYATAPNGIDADPSQVVTFLLDDPKTGTGFPSARVGSLTTYQAYTLANGLWISPTYNSQSAASTILDDIATATNSAWVWSSGLLTLVPYGDQSITANGYTYTAPSSPVYALGMDDFLPNSYGSGVSSTDPVQFVRKRPADVINSVKLECLDRNNQYNPAVIEAKDQALVDTFGLRQSATKQSHLFCDLNAGRLSAQLQLQRQAIRNQYTFALDQRYIALDPMDIVSITDSYLGLSNQWVRILEITEQDDGSLAFVAEEYLNGTGNAPAYSFQSGTGYISNYNQDPGTTNTPVLFVPPIELAATGLEVWMAVSGVNTSLWGGCDVWISQDNNTYANVGRITGESRQGVLTASLASHSDPDTSDTLSVDLTQSLGALLSGTQADADNFNTLCYIDGELICYQTATLTAAHQYNLTYLRRGCFGTAITSHNNGTQFARIDGGIFKFPINKNQIGGTVFIKLVNFNLWGSGQQTLAGVNPITFVVPYPPAPAQVQNFSAQQQGSVVVFGWDDLAPYDVGLKGYDIAFGNPGSAWSAKELLTEASRATEMTNAAVPPGTWEFSIRAHDIADQLGAISTVQLTVTNVNSIISEVVQEPSWLGTLTNCVAHYTGVLVPENQYTPSHYGVISAPATPTTGSISGGSLGSTTYYVKITYVDATGETIASSEATQAVTANHLLTVTSPPASGLATGWNVYVSTTSGAETLQNVAPIGIGANWTEPTSGLVAGVSPPANNQTGFQCFDLFVPDPFSSCSYIAPTVDTGYNDALRVYATTASSLGAGQSGSAASLQFEIDTWLTGQSDPATYTPWTIGFVTLRYMNAELVYTGITAGNVSYITDFTPIVDTAPTIESAGSVVIAGGGTTITFPTPYHSPPYVQVSVVGNTALYATAAAISATGFTAHVWNSSGSDVGGTISWTATGS